MGVLQGTPRTATVRALRDSRLAGLAADRFLELLDQHPELLRPLVLLLVERLSRSSSEREPPALSTLLLVSISAGLRCEGLRSELEASLLAAPGTRVLTPSDVETELGLGASSAPLGTELHRAVTVLLSRAESAAGLLVILADSTTPAWTERCARQADRLVLVADARERPGPPPPEVERALESSEGELLLVHFADARPTGSIDWLEAIPVREHHHLRRGRVEDAERFVRRITGTALGLVFGGGGARGVAHLGVVRALRERGMVIDYVAGTSAGSVLAGQVGLGWSVEELRERNRELWMKQKPTNDYTLPLASLLAGRKVTRLMREMFGEQCIEDLTTGYFCVAANLTRARVEILDRGPLWWAMMASSALPGVVPPVLRDGEVLVDGSVLNNLPGDLMRQRFRGRIITVDVSPATELRVDPGLRAYPSAARLLRSSLGRFFRGPGPAVPLLPELLARSASLSSDARSQEIARRADLYLAPDVGRFRTLDWSAFDELEEIGYRTAAAALEDA